MATKKIQSAIKGSIANPEAANAVLVALDTSADLGELSALDSASDVANIAVPATATAEDAANKINTLLTSLRAAGILA